MCNESGVRLEYLPPYSPDYNPIEEAFATVKRWIKLNYVMVDNYEAFDKFLEAAMYAQVGKAGNHFRSCHIHIEE
jgi:hypothetical protein